MCICGAVMSERARRADVASAAACYARVRAAFWRDNVQLRIATEEHAAPVGYGGNLDGSERGVVVGELFVAGFLLGHVEIVTLDIDVRGVSWYGLARDTMLFEVLVWISGQYTVLRW